MDACRAAEGSRAEHASQSLDNFVAHRIERSRADANENLVILNAWRAPNLPVSHDSLLVLEH